MRERAMLARRRDTRGGALDTRGGASGLPCFGHTGRMVVKCTRVWAGPGVVRVWTTGRVSFHSAGRGSSSGTCGVILFVFHHFRAARGRFGQPSDHAFDRKENETDFLFFVSFRLILSHPLLLIWMVLIMSREPERGALEGRAWPGEKLTGAFWIWDRIRQDPGTRALDGEEMAVNGAAGCCSRSRSLSIRGRDRVHRWIRCDRNKRPGVFGP